MLDPSWSSMGASTSSSLPSSTSSPTATESAAPAPISPGTGTGTSVIDTATPSESMIESNSSIETKSVENHHHDMGSSMVSESSGSTSSWVQVEQTMNQVAASAAVAVQPHNNGNEDHKIPTSDETPSTTTSAVPSPYPSPYPSLSPPDEDTWSHDDLSLGDDEGLASSISSLSSLQANTHDSDHAIADDDLQQHTPQTTTATSLGASSLGVSHITSSWHGNFQSLHDATNDHDSPPLSTTSSPISSTTSHSLAPSPHPDMTSSSFVNVSTSTLASTLAASTLAATAMATSMAQPHVTSVPIEIPSPSLYPLISNQSDHSDNDDMNHSTTSSGAILIATMCGLFLGLMASSWYFSRRSRKRGLESDTTIATLQRLLSEKDAELKRITDLFQQYLATPIVVRLTER